MALHVTPGPERVSCYYMLTLDGLLGGVVIKCGGAFLTFTPRNAPQDDTAENRAAFLALGLEWLGDEGFEVDVT